MTTLLTDLFQYGALTFTGEDAKTFLQGQCTCDLNDVSPSQAVWGAQCDIKGRVQSFFRLIQTPSAEHYDLVMPKTLVPVAEAAFKKYSLFSKVTLTPKVTGLQFLGVTGETAAEQLSPLFQETDLNQKDAVAWHLEGSNLVACAYRLPGELPRYVVYGQEKAVTSIQEKLRAEAVEGSIQDWVLAEIAAGIPEVLPETAGKFLPHHIGLVALDAVNFDKGCYLGQEIIARMQWRGNIKKHLKQARIIREEDTPQPGELLYNQPDRAENPIGEIVRVGTLDLKTEALLISLKENEPVFYHKTPVKVIG